MTPSLGSFSLGKITDNAAKSGSETTLAWHSRTYFDEKSKPQAETSKRNIELHKRFPEIAKEEILIEDYICALGRGATLVQGRIYMTRRRCCFYSSMLGMIYRFYFCSFLSRDAAFEKLVSIWKQSNVESFFSASFHGEITVDEGTMTSRPSSPPTMELPPKPASDPSEKDTVCLHDHSKAILVTDQVFGCSIKQLWSLLHGDETSPVVTVMDQSKKPSFLEWFLAQKRAVVNLEKTTWMVGGKEELESLPLELAKVGDTRTIFFDMNFGLQTAGSKQVITVKSVTPTAICIHSKTTNSGIPFANSYSTATVMCIKEEEPGRSSRLVVSYYIEFERDCYSIIKNPVQNAMKTKIPEFYNDLVCQLQRHFDAESGVQCPQTPPEPDSGIEKSQPMEELAACPETGVIKVPRYVAVGFIACFVMWIAVVVGLSYRLHHVFQHMTALQQQVNYLQGH
ncbi:hypothetical protein HDU91_004706 [Kappamyces sp. JEL0680]|nr:hypothetical protein HDU91_004706 [Kappamyces sp. JEL0680]